MTEIAQNFYALASIVVFLGVAVVVVAGAGEVLGRGWLTRLAAALDGIELWGGFVIAAFAMAGSLYFSEIAHYIPCPLCWYQRIAMYPLVLLLGLAAIRRERVIALYALVLAVIGAGIALYHYQLEWFPDQAAICKEGSLCHVIWFRALGFATIPYLSLAAFSGVAAFCVLALWNRRAATAEA